MTESSVDGAASSQVRSSLLRAIWDLRFWWMIPMSVVAVFLLILLVMFSGEAPFTYTF